MRGGDISVERGDVLHHGLQTIVQVGELRVDGDRRGGFVGEGVGARGGATAPGVVGGDVVFLCVGVGVGVGVGGWGVRSHIVSGDDELEDFEGVGILC